MKIFVYILINSLFILLPLVVSIAFFTLAERKIIAAIQRRRGPNIVGYWGILQPFADGFKLLIKEVVIPSSTTRFLFLLAPYAIFVFSFVNWAFLPFDTEHIISDVISAILYIYAISSLGVYGIILAGWASNSKYPFLGALRSAAQIISYEVSIGLLFVIIAAINESLNLIEIVNLQSYFGWNIIYIFPLCVIFLISAVAETNRAPFDLPEAEAEIVAGYNLEYSSITFAFFFLGEYSNILIICTLFALIFLGGWLPIFNFITPLWLQLKVIFMCYIFVLIRATLPRYRYDQLIEICWQIFIPLNFLYLLTLVFLR